jgi:hemerythrin
MAIKWTSALSVGHPRIDTQHQELFKRLDLLLGAMLKGDRTEVGRLFDFLGTYVVEHFGMEEQLMKDSRYPDAQAHAEIHGRFVSEYQALRQSYETTGGGAAITIKLQNFVGEWLKNHIAGTDSALATYLARRAA